MKSAYGAPTNRDSAAIALELLDRAITGDVGTISALSSARVEISLCPHCGAVSRVVLSTSPRGGRSSSTRSQSCSSSPQPAPVACSKSRSTKRAKQ